MKSKLTVLSFALGLTLSTLVSAKSIPAVCSSDFAKFPVVTQQPNGTMSICSAVPASFITKQQAQQQALAMNINEARQLCQRGFKNVKSPQTLNYSQAVAVVSTIVCR